MAEPVDIAIVGMAGLFPKAPNTDVFWSNILNKVDATGDPPADWLGEPKLFDPAASPDEMRLYTMRGGFLGDLARFDPRPFGAMPIAIVGGEPDQFLALKCAQAALEDASLGANVDFPRERSGCILGHAIHANRANVNGMQHGVIVDQMVEIVGALFPEAAADGKEQLKQLLHSKLPKCSADTMPALIPNMMTGRICNRLDLMGPNYIMDAACASTTLAIEAAVSELRRGRADVMLAGGVNTTTSTLVFGVFCQLGALSRTAKVRPFSKGGDGTLLGEGQGIFVLKRLEDALQADDRIYAVIKSIGSASDGRSSGLMAPRLEGEALAMRRAYELGGVDPASIDLIEAHGTGIPLGDRTEIEAIRQVFGERRKKYPDGALGSVKSMIGHCIPAAGAASIIKTAMALHEKILPPMLCEEVSPDLGIDRTRFYINTQTRPWLCDPSRPRRAGVNAFGFGGINSHLVLEESPLREKDATAAFGVRRLAGPELFCFANRTREGLFADMDAARAAAHGAETDALGAFADKLSRGGNAGDFRLAILADSWNDLVAKLDTARGKLDEAETFASRNGVYFRAKPVEGKVAFLFPGENSQYVGMMERVALASPAASAWLDRLEGLYGDVRKVPHRHLLYPAPTGLTEEERAEIAAPLGEIAEGSEAVFFADTAYFRLLTALGVEADFMLGHSTGENAAIVSSGVADMSDEETSSYIRAMNAIFSRIEREGKVPSGVLLSVGAAEAGEVERVLVDFPDVQLTMDNCPNQKILFGPEERMAEVKERFVANGAVCAVLPMSWAYHTEHLRPLADEFRKLFSGVRMGKPRAQLYSCSTAAPLPEDEAEAREIIVGQYVTRVRFCEAVRRLYQDGARVFIEVGADNSLSGFVRDSLGALPHLSLSCDNPKRDSLTALLTMLGQLFAAGRFDPARLAPRRAKARPVRNEPLLPSALPLIHLSAEEGARMRALFAPTAAAAAAPPAPRLPAPSYRDLTADLGSAFGARVALARFDRAFQSTEEWLAAAHALLTPEEIEGPLARIAERQPARRQEWLLGRLAAKRAIAALANGAGPASILSDSESRPVVRLAGSAVAPFVSITHKNGLAVAAAAPAPIGVDLESLASLRDPDIFADRVLTADERAFADGADDLASTVVVFWSLKEAASKALAAPFVGQERLFAVEAINPSAQRARIAFEARAADAAYMVKDGYVCALAAVSP
ncbi:MAG: beta-ketoacyl synthase N-terminal-like domain-containing protein [Parvularculaceae bacterium]